MARELHHPTPEQFSLALILAALSDETRLEIVRRLAENENLCSAFTACAPKSNLSYHFQRLREAGIVRVRIDGPYRWISLRLDELEERFPGVMSSILASAGLPQKGDDPPLTPETATAPMPRETSGR